jgi:hypothetical protein
LALQDPSSDQPAAEQLDPRPDHQPALVAPLEFRLDQWQVRSHPLVPHQWRAQHHLLAGHHPQVQRRPRSRRPPV